MACFLPHPYFNPRPPRGERHKLRTLRGLSMTFQSTPSARRATASGFVPNSYSSISIHALREESDRYLPACLHRRFDFNPRPPRGERPGFGSATPTFNRFQSTPSARRATIVKTFFFKIRKFQSTPSARRATDVVYSQIYNLRISIHALREESDPPAAAAFFVSMDFNPRPPRGERPPALRPVQSDFPISIHALREESDSCWQ